MKRTAFGKNLQLNRIIIEGMENKGRMKKKQAYVQSGKKIDEGPPNTPGEMKVGINKRTLGYEGEATRGGGGYDIIGETQL